jgi:hypothetical protein
MRCIDDARAANLDSPSVTEPLLSAPTTSSTRSTDTDSDPDELRFRLEHVCRVPAEARDSVRLWLASQPSTS